MPDVQFTEADTSGGVVRSYILNSNAKKHTDPRARARLDVISTVSIDKRDNSLISGMMLSPSTFIEQKLLPIFLPHGYPHTVTPDYAPYQIYDSLQAFTSTIAGLLASRAVLQSLGVDDNLSKSTATYATLLSIAQATISNLSTIYFAHHASSRIAPEVKFYRFLADIVNDIAFVLDCLSPSLPHSLRVPVLCLGAACRAICGVAGGSAKAELSAHFAKNGNIGELNAKDSSQETVVNLVGMWVGGVVVSRVDGVLATWFWLLGLLASHLWFNYCAVQSVRLKTLNKTRARKVLGDLIRQGTCPDIDDVGASEEIFRRGELLRPVDGTKSWTISIGGSLISLLENVKGSTIMVSGSIEADSKQVAAILDMFQAEMYLLSANVETRQLVIVLKQGAASEDQIKAWCHAIRLMDECNKTSPHSASDVNQTTRDTQSANSSEWPAVQGKLREAQWDISTSMLETTPGLRLSLN